MHPLASTKCAGRLLMALAAITSIVLMASCGSSSPITTINPIGFSNSSLNGTYVFSSQGTDNDGAPLNIAGTLVANGKGGIGSGGMMDVIDPRFTSIPAQAAQAITGGSYAVGPDGRGQASLTTTAYGTFVLDFVLTSSSGGLVTEFDGNGTGSGTLDLQTAVTSLSQLAGPYAFSLAGSDSNGNPLATAGAFTLNPNSNVLAPGVEDFNDGGIPYTNETLAAPAVTLGSGTVPGTITLTTASFALTYDFYPIDATHWKLIETDYKDFLAGDVFTQTGASSIPQGTMVFTMAGGTNASGPIANGGLMTSDGTGNFSGGLEDINDAGTIPAAQAQFRGALDAGASGPVGGRVFVNLTGFVPATQWVIYPSSGGLLMLEMDSVNVTAGVAYAQTATSFIVPASYGLNLTGANGGGEVDDIAQFNATTAVSPATNMTGVLDENVMGSRAYDEPLNSATYTPDSPATGRGSIIATIPNTYIGGMTLEYYAVNGSTALFIDVDPSSSGYPQVAVGTFEAQSSVQPVGGARSHVAIVHPIVRPHAALRRK